MVKQAQADKMKAYFRRMDPSGNGLISKNQMGDLLVQLGMSRDSVEQLFRMTSFVNDQGDVAYIVFVDWLTGRIPEVVYAKNTCSSPKGQSQLDHLADVGLRGMSRARRILWEGRERASVNMPAALEAFLGTTSLKAEVQERMRAVWIATVSGMDAKQAPADVIKLANSDAAHWEEFAQHCIEKLLFEVYHKVDLDEDGKLSAQELMTFLMLVTVQSQQTKFALSPADAELIVQEFDIALDGRLSKAEFGHMVNALKREVLAGHERLAPQTTFPHLLLNFDVNNTIVISDTMTGADAEDLISMSFAGCAWGIVIPRFVGQEVWLLVCPEPSVAQPWKGLVSYAQYIVDSHPLPDSKEGKSVDEVEAVKEARRTALRSFCKPNHPGEALRPHLNKLKAALHHECKLLPSFLYLLQELKRSGRSFTLVFRTFGVDVDEALEQEFNSFCAGRHPLFPGGLVLDGSDGLQDYRMNLSGASTVGTLWRRSDELALVWGTRRQPPKGAGLNFFDDFPDVTVVNGAAKVAESLEGAYRERGTVVLRDHYWGWAEAQCNGRGGKPFFLRIEDEEVLPVFFDDHVRPADPNIVDPIDVRDWPTRLPMAQVYNVHCVPARLLHSISEISYFWDQLMRCEELKVAQLLRRRKVASMLYDAAAIRRVLRLLEGDLPAMSRHASRRDSRQSSKGHADEQLVFTPWRETETVKTAMPFVGLS